MRVRLHHLLLFLMLLAAEAGRYHATDRLGCSYLDVDMHSLCNGTAFSTWLGWFDLSGGEVAHQWLETDVRAPLGIVSSWICDGSLWSTYQVSDCPSDSANPGHRAILVLGSSYDQIGPGFAAGDDHDAFVGVTLGAEPDVYFPIGGGSHFLLGGQILFILDVEVVQEPVGVDLILEDERNPMAVDLGSTARGMYLVADTEDMDCRSYHFEMVDAEAMVWRYPDSGSFATYAEGSCLDDYTPPP